MNNPSEEVPIWAYFALVVGVLSLGGSAIFVRWAQAPGTVTSFYRMLIAVVLLALPYARQSRRAQRPPGVRRQGLGLALLGGLVFAGDLAFWSTGVMMSGATNPTLLANTAPLWVGLGAVFFFRERHELRFWVGLALAIIGSLLVLGLETLKSFELGLGSAFGLLAGVFYAGYFLFTQRGRQKLDSLSYFWWAALSSTLALLAIILLLGQPLAGYSFRTYANIAALGVVTQVIGYLAMTYALGFLPASVVAPTMVGQPIVTAVFAWLLLGETLSIWHLIGGAAVLAGVYTVHRFQRQPAVKTPLHRAGV